MPNKSVKYGLKLFCICDANIRYIIFGIFYMGEEVQKKLRENVVQGLWSKLRSTRHNMPTDDFFSSVPLAQCLLETLLWELQWDKADILPSFLILGSLQHRGWIQWQPYHSQLCQKEKGNCCTPQHNVLIDHILQQAKGSIDTMDQMVGTYACKCGTT